MHLKTESEHPNRERKEIAYLKMLGKSDIHRFFVAEFDECHRFLLPVEVIGRDFYACYL
jgi:hypothetical protein